MKIMPVVGYGNVVPFKANKSVIKDSGQVVKLLDDNGYHVGEKDDFDFLTSEVKELEMAIKNKDYVNLQEEVGDVLFDTIMLAKHYNVNPEIALSKTNQKITQRIELAQIYARKPLTDYTYKERMSFWNMAKKELRKKEA